MDPVKKHILKCRETMSLEEFTTFFRNCRYAGCCGIDSKIHNFTAEHVFFGIQIGVDALADNYECLGMFINYPMYIRRLVDEQNIPVNKFVNIFPRLCDSYNHESFLAVKFLVESGIQVEDVSWFPGICSETSLEIVKYWVEEFGIDPHIDDDQALICSLQNEDASIMEYLLDRGLELPELPDIEGGISPEHIEILMQRKIINMQEMLYNQLNYALLESENRNSLRLLMGYCDNEMIAETIKQVLKKSTFREIQMNRIV